MDSYLVSVLSNIGMFAFIALSAYLLLLVGEISFGRHRHQQGGEAGERRPPDQPEPERPAPDRGGDACAIGADREERLLAERDLADQQQQISR